MYYYIYDTYKYVPLIAALISQKSLLWSAQTVQDIATFPMETIGNPPSDTELFTERLLRSSSCPDLLGWSTSPGRLPRYISKQGVVYELSVSMTMYPNTSF